MNREMNVTDLPNREIAGLYYDHFEKYLGKATDYIKFTHPELDSKILVLVYPNVFDGCVTFATLGLSTFSKEVGSFGEVVCVVDAKDEYVADLLFDTVKTIILKRMKLGWGTLIGENSLVAPRFVHDTQKTAIYIAKPRPFPDEFEMLEVKGAMEDVPRVYLAVFISASEHQLFSDGGAVELERYFEENKIDLFDVMRTA